LFCIERGEIFIARLKMVLTPRKHKQTEEKNSNQSCKKQQQQQQQQQQHYIKAGFVTATFQTDIYQV